jgi:hypothetical protein
MVVGARVPADEAVVEIIKPPRENRGGNFFVRV